MKLYTAERTNEKSISDNPIYQRHLFAYEQAIKYVKGNVLEVGCGEGYGSKLLAPHADKYTAVDKFEALNKENLKGIEFIQMNVPLLPNFKDNTFDYGKGKVKVFDQKGRTAAKPFNGDDGFEIMWVLYGDDGKVYENWSNSISSSSFYFIKWFN